MGSAPRFIANFGVYVNDFAFHGPETTLESYSSNGHLNIVRLVLKLVDSAEFILKPLKPVIVTKERVSFDNKDPVEIGIGYSWNYWEYFRNQFD